jgi:hypothetical protein
MSHSTRHFIRHYIEMVVVMFAGMIVLGIPGDAGLMVIGSGTAELRDDAPALVFLGMAATMTIPMVAWTRFRGHTWQRCLEMAASMIIPTLVAIALLATGAASFGTLMGLEHIAMLIGMLIAMLLRPSEYTGHTHRARRPPRGDRVSVHQDAPSIFLGPASARAAWRSTCTGPAPHPA